MFCIGESSTEQVITTKVVYYIPCLYYELYVNKAFDEKVKFLTFSVKMRLKYFKTLLEAQVSPIIQVPIQIGT